MRGDLVYEKLGEIDPALVAEALLEAAPMPELYHLGGNNPPPPKKHPNFRKALVACACILLAGILLVGGGVVMYRSGLLGSIVPNTEPVTELETDDPNARYKGTVTITVGKTGQTVVLADDPALEVLGMRIKKLLNRIADGEPSPDTYTMGEYVLNVDGIEIWISVDQSRYMFMKDRQEMLEWVLDAQIAGELEALLRQSTPRIDPTVNGTNGVSEPETDPETVPDPESQPFSFGYELTTPSTVSGGDTVEIILSLTNNGAGFSYYGCVSDYAPKAKLIAAVAGETVTLEVEYATTSDVAKDRWIDTGDTGKGRIYVTIPSDEYLHGASFDLVLTYKDHTRVFRDVLTVDTAPSDHSAGNTDLEIVSRTPAVTVAAP